MDKLLVLTDIKGKGYQAHRLVSEAKAVGIEAVNKSYRDLKVILTKGSTHIFIEDEPLNNYKYLIYRCARTIIGFELYKYCSDHKIVFLNSASYGEFPEDIDKLKQYYLFAKNNIPYPDTSYGIPLKEITSAYLAKPIHGSFGNGIKLAIDIKPDELPNYLIQQKLNSRSDYRVIVLDKKIVGVMKRTAKENMIVTNVAAGGDFEASTLPSQILQIAIKAADVLNLEYAGVDIMLDNDAIPFVLEANRNAYFEGFEKCTGINLAKEIVAYITNKTI